MKIGVQTAFNAATPPELCGEIGRTAEQHGFHSLWVPEHVVFFREYGSRYPYSADGRIPGNPESLCDPLVSLTWIAAQTTKIRLGTGILIVPQRDPVYAARQIADLDYLSGGRFDLGIGVGWLREEFDALGIPWERRGARTEECLEVMKRLWCDEVSSYDGAFYSLPPCVQSPKPVQSPHPPLIFGGESPATFRRIAAMGQGWFAFGFTPDALGERLALLDTELAAVGRTRQDVQIHAAPPMAPLEDGALGAYEQLGVDQLILPLLAGSSEKLGERASRLAEGVAAFL